MLGRVHLSGHLDHMSREQRELVAEAVRVYKELRAAIASALPFWPLGLPRWADPWVALGLRAPAASLPDRLAPRPAAGNRCQSASRRRSDSVPVPHLQGVPVTAEVLYPRHAGAEADWSASVGLLTVTLPGLPVGLRPAPCAQRQ